MPKCLLISALSPQQKKSTQVIMLKSDDVESDGVESNDVESGDVESDDVESDDVASDDAENLCRNAR